MMFTLYVDGDSEQSLVAQTNLECLCKQHIGDGCSIRIVDLARDPQLAVEAQIVALPTLEIDAHGRRRRFVGDLSLAPSVISALGMVESSRRMLQDSRARLERVLATAPKSPPAGD
jgi:circadian clock protein KaiB